MKAFTSVASFAAFAQAFQGGASSGDPPTINLAASAPNAPKSTNLGATLLGGGGGGGCPPYWTADPYNEKFACSECVSTNCRQTNGDTYVYGFQHYNTAGASIQGSCMKTDATCTSVVQPGLLGGGGGTGEKQLCAYTPDECDLAGKDAYAMAGLNQPCADYTVCKRNCQCIGGVCKQDPTSSDTCEYQQ